jgi:hypothetical protein
MEKQNILFIGIAVFIIAIALGLFYMNGMLSTASPQTRGQEDVSNLSFRAEAVSDDNYLTFRYIPATSMAGPVTVVFKAQEDTKALFTDKKIFESVTPDNPIEIAMKKSGNGTYSMIMLISDRMNNLVHMSTTTWYGSNATYSTNSASFSAVSRS